MKKNEIMNRISGTVGRAGLQLKKYSPEILITVGVVGTVASAVMACKATLKVNEILDESQKNLDRVHVATETGVTESGATYSLEDSKKDTAIVCVQTGVKLAKLYAPSVALGALSIGCILSSNNILRKRYISAAAAYAAVDKSFKDYRSHVVERFGEEVDKQLKYNLKACEVEETVTDDMGNEKKVKKTIQVADIGECSDYARFFDEVNSTFWTKDPDYNLMFIRAQQQYANDLLRSRHHLFLNEVYDMLGMDRTKAGQIVGWVYNPDNQIGDDYVDFGLNDIFKVNGRVVDNEAFLKGYERSVLLDFNVAGNVLDMI